ncbi:MAG: hypothetical protein HYY18_04510 [Planctomycetes bacterium]|nr:hypothetical protein [Planctomycetota bacterium]
MLPRAAATVVFILSLALTTLADGTTAGTSGNDVKSRVETLKTSLKGADAAAKKAAVEACGSAPHPMTAAALGTVLCGESDELRLAAAETLGKMKGLSEAARALHAGIGANTKKPGVLQAIFRAVASVNDLASIPVCRKFAVDFLLSPLQDMGAALAASAEALGALRHKDAVDALIAVRARAAAQARGMNPAAREALEAAARASLEKLTGATVGEPQAFESWWKRNGYTFNDDLTARPKGYRRGGPGMDGGMGGGFGGR